MHYLSRFLIAPSLLVSLVCTTGCPKGSSAPDATPCDMEVFWGPQRINDFQPFVDGDRAELTLGFQGFRYVSSTIKMVTDQNPQQGQILFQIEVDGQEAYTVSVPLEAPSPEADGARYADNVLVFFNDVPVAELIGRDVRVTARAALDSCRGIHSADVLVVDDDNCVEQPDGMLTCEDAGPS